MKTIARRMAALGRLSWVERGRPRAAILLLGLGCWLCYLAVAVSARSLHEAASGSHGLLGLLALFGVAFSLYLVALRVAIRLPDDRRMLTVVWAGAVVFRLTLLVSNPIEEIDLYRYVWDGAVSTQGVSPFRYSPQQVLASSADDELPADLAKLVRLRDQSPELAAILRRVHFGELPTIYPPVSQWVFAACSWLTPDGSSVTTRLLLMKAWFVAFDLATLALIVRLLRQAGRHRGWSLAYGWCPLVVKEIANSGHLDSLATFCAIGSLSLLIAAISKRSEQNQPERASVRFEPLRTGASALRLIEWLRTPVGLALAAALLLAVGVGAKLFPIVLAPLLFWVMARRISWSVGVAAGLLFVVASVGLLWPMRPADTLPHRFDESEVATLAAEQPPIPPADVATTPRDPSESLRAFLGRWEMNDFLFLIVIENLRPSAGLRPEQIAWFTVTPESWRQSLVTNVTHAAGMASDRVPFSLTRLLLGGVFVCVACVLAWRAAADRPRPSMTQGVPPIRVGEPSPSWEHSPSLALRVSEILTAAFLTLAWCWLLLPTQNPWYLTWSLPLLPFALNRAWFALSGLAFFYYVRFWMTSQFSSAVLNTPYSGPQFFDFVITWLEFAPWLVWLSCGRVSALAVCSGEPVGVSHRTNFDVTQRMNTSGG